MRTPHDRQVKVWLDDELDQELRRRAHDLHQPISVLVRQMIIEGLEYSLYSSRPEKRVEGAERTG